MTEIGDLKFNSGLCLCMAYFCCGLSLGVFLMADNMSVGDPEWIAGITICVIGVALVGLHDIIRKKIRTMETMESQDAEGGSL